MIPIASLAKLYRYNKTKLDPLKLLLRCFFLRCFYVALLFFSACFDYHERLELNKDLSGSVLISYTVPLSKRQAKADAHFSLLSFLPVNVDTIKKHYEDLIESKIARLTGLKVTTIGGVNNKVAKKIKVQYRLHFTKLMVLEHTPLGNTRVVVGLTKARIKRDFPSIQEIQRPSLPLLKHLHKYLKQKLSDHMISYTTHLPQELSIKTNRGTFTDKTSSHSYGYSLSHSLDSDKNTNWTLTLQKSKYDADDD